MQLKPFNLDKYEFTDETKEKNRAGNGGNNMKPEFKVIVAGSRTFQDSELAYLKLDKLLSAKFHSHRIVIISGTAQGADRIGECYARDRGLKVLRFPAEWEKHGRSAGYKRNVVMACAANACIVFWDGESKGAKHMIDTAKNKGLPLRVIKFK